MLRVVVVIVVDLCRHPFLHSPKWYPGEGENRHTGTVTGAVEWLPVLEGPVPPRHEPAQHPQLAAHTA